MNATIVKNKAFAISSIVLQDSEVVQQKPFASFIDFIHGQNNFYLHFVHAKEGDLFRYRERPAFVRFQTINRDIEQEITDETMKIFSHGRRDLNKLPYNKLFDAYSIMSRLVSINDPYIRMVDGSGDNLFLTR